MMTKKDTSVVVRELRVSVANADFLIVAPSKVIDVVDRMLEHVSREWTDSEVPLRIDVRYEGDVWHVGGSAPAGQKTLGRLSALPQVAGAIVSSMLAELSYHRTSTSGAPPFSNVMVRRSHSSATIGKRASR